MLYGGQTSRNYGFYIDVRNQATYTLSALAEGHTYYFAVTSYDTFGNESAFSDEGSITISATSTDPPAIGALQ